MRNKLSFYDSTVREDIIICLCASYAAAAFCADTRLDAELMRWVRIAAFAGMAGCWLTMAFFNGIRMRKGFAAGMALYLALPPLTELVFASVRALKFSSAGIVIREICKFVSKLPYREIENITGINGMICSVSLALGGILLYSAGSFYTRSSVLLAEEREGGSIRKD